MKINDRKLIVILSIIFGLASFAVIIFSFSKPILQDEGVFLTISKGLTNGLLPYRDFFDHKTPGIYFFLALLVFLFGKNIVFYKIVFLIINFLSAYLVFLISEKLRKNSGVLSASVFLFSLYIFEGYFLIAEPLVIFLLLLAVWFLLKDGKNQKQDIFWGGLFAGLSFLMKQTAIVSALALAVYVFIKNRNMFKDFVLGLSVGPSMVFIWLLFSGILQESFNQIILYNFSYPKESFAIVFEGFKNSFSSTWFIWLGLIGYIFISKDKYKKLFLALIFLSIPVFLIRHYPHYWIQIIPFVAIVFSLSYLQLVKNKVFYFLSLILISWTVFSTAQWFLWMSNNKWEAEFLAQTEVTDYLENLDDEYLLAENRFTYFYFSSTKKTLNKYLYMTEITETENAQQKTLKNIQDSKNLVVLWPSDGNIYAKEIDKYLKDNLVKKINFKDLGLDVYVKP